MPQLSDWTLERIEKFAATRIVSTAVLDSQCWIHSAGFAMLESIGGIASRAATPVLSIATVWTG